MGIYRGTGGTGDSTTDTTVTTVTEKAAEAASSATSAANSATSAANSASSASTSETNAATSETNAANSATASATSATASETAKTASQAAQTAAETAQTNAETAEANAVTAKNQAVSAKDNAVTAQTAAETAETNAETAYANTLAIFGDATDVQNAVDSASTSATNAATSATQAATSATNAANSATSAGTSETNAASSASQAATSANTAGSHATDAETAKDAAETAQAAAEAAEANINGLYLGSLADDPTLDGNGVAVTTGDLYFNTTEQEVRVYTDGDVWEPVVDLAGDITVNSLTSNNDVVVKGNLEVQGTTITVDSATAQTIDLGDNDKIRLGDGDDLQVYHDGTDSYITNTTGTLKLSGNTDVTGNITVSGTVDGRDVATDGSKLDGIEAGATADQTKADIDALAINADQVDGLEASQFLRSDADDAATGNITVNGALKTNTADSSNKGLIIENTGGALVNAYFAGSGSTDNFVLTRSGTGGAEFEITSAGVVNLGHNGNGIKLATTSSGVDITGTVVADGLTVDGDATLQNTSGSVLLKLDGSTYPEIRMLEGDTTDKNGRIVNNGGQLTFQTLADGGTTTNRFQINHTSGDVKFYSDDGTSQDFYWDASTSKLGLGTTSPAVSLDVRGDGTFYSGASTTFTVGDGISAGESSTFNLKASYNGNRYFNFNRGTAVESRILCDSNEDLNIDFARGFSADFRIRRGSSGLKVSEFYDTGDIAFYDDTGASQDFYWDASTSRLGLGTTSPSAPLTVDTSAGTFSVDAEGGASNLLHSTGALILRSGQFQTQINKSNNTPIARFMTSSGDVIFYDDTGTSQRFYWDASAESLGIGTTSPSATLDLTSSSNGHGLKIRQGNAGSGYHSAINFEGSNGSGGYVSVASIKAYQETNGVNGSLRFYTNTTGSERMRIDSSGNLLVGTTSQISSGKVSISGGTSASGITATTDATSGYSAAVFKRTASDGALITFQNDVNVDVGIISTNYNDMFIGTGDTGLYFSDSTDDIQPFNPTTTGSRDNAISLGTSNRRFKDLYLSGGVYLGGTGSANLLDDYEEGTWTPVLGGLTSTSGQTYNIQAGWYRKVGSLVTASFFCDLTTAGTISGVAVINGLPLTSQAISGNYRGHISSVGYSGLGISPNSIAATVLNNTTQVRLGFATSITNSQNFNTSGVFIDGSQLQGTITYITG